jgi:penicillin-binding protein 1A
MGRPVAGKTGTTNDAFDAWFMGFSPELVTGVWVGYDTYESPMGKYETGGHTALPIWMDFMSAALKGRPIRDFVAPDGVTWVPINSKTGAYSPGGGMMEVYRTGTEPSAEAAPTGSAPSDLYRNQEL